MNFLESMALSCALYLQDDEERLPLPDWAKAEIWLGWWCRNLQLKNKRLLVVAILPSRELAAAFVGMGCILAGTRMFSGELTWERFKSLQKGTDIFWRSPKGRGGYSGVILDRDALGPETIRVQIVKGGRRSDAGSIFEFSEKWFNDCLFSEAKLPAGQRKGALESAVMFCNQLGLEVNSPWMSTVGAEACLVTNQARFRHELLGLKVGVDSHPPTSMADVLCLQNGTDISASKLRLVSSGNYSGMSVPVTILDGGGAFGRIELVESGNVLVLLKRSEYTAEIQNYLLELRNVANAFSIDIAGDIPSSFPPGVELTAFVVQRE